MASRGPAVWRLLPIMLLLLLVPASTLFAANSIKLRAESLVRFLQRDTATKTDAQVIPAYEYLQFDLGTPGEQALTFHANGWGRVDLTDNNYFTDQTAGELLYGYLEYRAPKHALTARLGRQAIFAGVANESIDGLYLDTALVENVGLSLYAGQPVALDNTNGRSGDSIYGGRVSTRLANRYNIGASYKMIKNDGNDAEEMAGVDFGLVFDPFYINGLSSYNLTSQGFAEHSYEAVAGSDIRTRIFYSMFSFEDYFNTGENNANPFRVLAMSAEKLSTYGIELTKKVNENFDAGVKLARFDYDIKESSNYGALVANWYGKGMNSIGGEIGYSEGENGRNDMILVRFYGFRALETAMLLDRVGIDMLYASYDQPIFNEDTSLFFSLSGHRKLTADLALKLAVDYESSPYFDSDVRGLMSLTYSYSAN